MSVVSPPSTNTRVGNSGAGGGADAGQLYQLSNIAWATSNISINTLQSSRLVPAITSGTQRPFSWFHSKKFRTIVVYAGTGASAASVTSPNSSSGQDYSYRYDTYSTVQLTCTPASGRTFLWWTNSNPGSGYGSNIADTNPLTLSSTDYTSDSFFNLWCVCGVTSPYSYTLQYSTISGCMDPESDLITEEGTIKAKDLEVGDRILSSAGYQTVSVVNVLVQPKYRVKTEKREVVVSSSHEFMFGEDRRKTTELAIGDYLTTVDGPEAITSIEFLGDGEVVEITVTPDHIYYVNGILSHNKAAQMNGWSNSADACALSGGSGNQTVYSPSSTIAVNTVFLSSSSGAPWNGIYYTVTGAYFQVSTTGQWVTLSYESDGSLLVGSVGTCSYDVNWTYTFSTAGSGYLQVNKNGTSTVYDFDGGSGSFTYNPGDNIDVYVESGASGFLLANVSGSVSDSSGTIWSDYADGGISVYIASPLLYPTGATYLSAISSEY